MNILLVENDLDLSELLTEVLTERNFFVKAVSNGLNLLQLVEKHQYNLIILNIVLPKLDGIELCRQIRAQGYHMPILFWSSQDFPEFKQAGFQAGANDYLPKPCKISTLLERINNLLNNHYYHHQTIRPKIETARKRLVQQYLQVA